MRSEWFHVQRPDTTAVPLCWWRTNWVWRAGASSSCCRTSTTNCCSTVSANTGWTGKVSLSERRHYRIESRKMYRWEFHCKYLTSRHQMMSSCYDFGFSFVGIFWWLSLYLCQWFSERNQTDQQNQNRGVYHFIISKNNLIVDVCSTALVDITSTLLLLNPDFTTAWNVR